MIRSDWKGSGVLTSHTQPEITPGRRAVQLSVKESGALGMPDFGRLHGLAVVQDGLAPHKRRQRIRKRLVSGGQRAGDLGELGAAVLVGDGVPELVAHDPTLSVPRLFREAGREPDDPGLFVVESVFAAFGAGGRIYREPHPKRRERGARVSESSESSADHRGTSSRHVTALG